MIRYDQIWPDMTRYDQIRPDMIRYDLIWSGHCDRGASLHWGTGLPQGPGGISTVWLYFAVHVHYNINISFLLIMCLFLLVMDLFSLTTKTFPWPAKTFEPTRCTFTLRWLRCGGGWVHASIHLLIKPLLSTFLTSHIFCSFEKYQEVSKILMNIIPTR